MAAYPDSVKSFTTKLDGAGNTINAAYVNDLQDEVTAIEGGLLNGTARLQSSNASVARLSVTNGSTLNTLQVGGGSTFAGTLSVAGGSTFTIRPVAPPPDCALVFLQSTVTIGSSALSTVSWNEQSILTNSSAHSTTTNPARLTPQSTGVYRFGAQIGFAAVSAQRRVRIQDSTGDLVAEQTLPASAASNDVNLQAMGIKRFDALGGYCVCVAVSSAGPSTLSLSTGAGVSWFLMEKL